MQFGFPIHLSTETANCFLSWKIAVPQGSILGTLLFSLYINDLPIVCPSVHIQMYADDTVLHVHEKNNKKKKKQQAAHQLTEATGHVSNGLTNSCLHMNVGKPVCVLQDNLLCNITLISQLIKRRSEWCLTSNIYDSS